jgi:hypothetical protein
MTGARLTISPVPVEEAPVFLRTYMNLRLALLALFARPAFGGDRTAARKTTTKTTKTA